MNEWRRTLKPKLVAVAVFTGAAVTIATGFPRRPFPMDETAGLLLAEHAALASPWVFSSACVLVFWRPRLGYGFGLIAGVCALPWLTWTEVVQYPFNSWILLNYVGEPSSDQNALLALVKLKILSITLAVIAISYSLMRLIRTRSWPIVALTFFVLILWFVDSATPYRMPIFADGVSPVFRIVHIEKLGLRFHETGVAVFRDGKVWVSRDSRRLLQYRFEIRNALGLMTRSTREHADKFLQSPELLKPDQPHSRRSWSSEEWYVMLDGARPVAFPREAGVQLFRELEQLATKEERPQATRDVCLGFCYEPVR